MVSELKEIRSFAGLSIMDTANSVIGDGYLNNYSVTNYALSRSIAADESDAATIAAVVASLIQDLGYAGIIKVDNS